MLHNFFDSTDLLKLPPPFPTFSLSLSHTNTNTNTNTNTHSTFSLYKLHHQNASLFISFSGFSSIFNLD
ncbi:hypothetical protein L6452_07092 [Arctium lappa]|uniref:Uncharacterized protein n=1 Tax=Arctium lappa TaxID=4217 RepID=A0ACB9EK88_ARCLA|nr:hypothetical protein L6452_07092 [Arctium lappa]